MMTYIKKHPVKLAVVVGLLSIVVYLFLTADPPGYCGEQKRFLSDEEFIASAVKYEATKRKMRIDGSDESVRNFHASHPDCCRVDRRDNRSLMDRILVTYTVEVRLIYEVNEETINKMNKKYIEKYYDDHILIGACGRVYSSDSYGEGHKTFPKY